MPKHYVVFTKHALPQPDVASSVWAAHTADAAANLGYSAVLVYCKRHWKTLNPIDLILPFRPRKPDRKLSEFYNIQERLLVSPLPIPWPVDATKGKLFNSSTVICKYYLPVHIKPTTKIVHTRDWNFAKAAVKNQLAVIYEHHHYENKQFEADIVNSPFFQVAVTLSDTVRDSMIASGMPPEKIIKTHSGMNDLFLKRQPQKAKEWRQKLLENEGDRLAVYSGGLYPFKGVDLLVEVAASLPKIQFVFAGGKGSQVVHYQQLARKLGAENVTFLGYLKQNQLASLLQAADLLVHPHCSGQAATFTSPLKFFDYMASGTPIVATEIPPLEEFKSADVVAGWCEPDSPTRLAQTIQRVLDTHPRRAGGYENSIEFARQFSCENRIAKIIDRVQESMKPQLLS